MSTGPSLLTQRVGDARLHVVRADVTDAVLMLRLGQHHDSDVPEGVDGNLGGGGVDNTVTLSQGMVLDHRARDPPPQPRPPRWGTLSVIPELQESF